MADPAIFFEMPFSWLTLKLFCLTPGDLYKGGKIHIDFPE